MITELRMQWWHCWWCETQCLLVKWRFSLLKLHLMCSGYNDNDLEVDGYKEVSLLTMSVYEATVLPIVVAVGVQKRFFDDHDLLGWVGGRCWLFWQLPVWRGFGIDDGCFWAELVADRIGSICAEARKLNIVTERAIEGRWCWLWVLLSNRIGFGSSIGELGLPALKCGVTEVTMWTICTEVGWKLKRKHYLMWKPNRVL